MARTVHLLVVDDDRQIRELTQDYLSQHGFRVSAVRDGREMRQLLKDQKIDLVILDLMLPGEDGLSLCRELRAVSSVPIIMLTAMGEETDRIVGLEMGADDYIAKPVNPRELLARIRAVLRRAQSTPESAGGLGRSALRFAGWTLDLARRRLESPDGVIVELSTGEYELLVAFAEHPGRVLSRDQLLDLAHGRVAGPFDRSIDVQVGRLRRKIEADPKNPETIKTVRGGGYVFTPAVDAL